MLERFFKLQANGTTVRRELVAGALIKLLSGRGREVKPLLYVLAVLFILYYIFCQR